MYAGVHSFKTCQVLRLVAMAKIGRFDGYYEASIRYGLWRFIPDIRTLLLS